MNDHLTISAHQLFAMFPDQEKARAYLESRLWPNGVRCPVCGLGERITVREEGFYRCNSCREDFTVRTSTIMERSHVPLHHWLAALGLIASDPTISVLTLAKTINVTIKTAGALLERVFGATGELLAEWHLKVDETRFRIVQEAPAYRVGRDGSIWTRWRAGKGGRLGLAWRPMNPPPDGDGYRVTPLYVGGRRITRKVSVLVCAAFHGPRPEGSECRHLDGVRTNDSAKNLAWGTPLENQADRKRHGRAPIGEANPNAALKDEQISEILALKGTVPQKTIAARFGITQSHVSRIHRGAQRATAHKRITYAELIA